MRTTIHVADDLLKAVMKETAAKTVTQAIRGALEGYLMHRRRVRLLRSFGKYPRWKVDVRAMRRNRDLG